MSHPQIAAILTTLKSALKASNMNYRELAERLEMSESGVKKMLNSGDVSLGRLLEICEVLHVPFGEVVTASGRGEPHVVDCRGDAFLLENVSYYFFLARLVELGYDRDAVQEATGLGDASTERYLRKLSQLGYFPLVRGDRSVVDPTFVRAAFRHVGVSVKVGPELGRLVRRDMAHRLLESAETLACEGSERLDAATLNRVTGSFVQRRLALTVDSIDALRRSLLELIETTTDRAALESVTHPEEELIEIGWSWALAPFDGTYPVPEL